MDRRPFDTTDTGHRSLKIGDERDVRLCTETFVAIIFSPPPCFVRP
jgi:hypothetical protein